MLILMLSNTSSVIFSLYKTSKLKSKSSKFIKILNPLKKIKKYDYRKPEKNILINWLEWFKAKKVGLAKRVY
jgi:hypothetical protein